MSCKSEYEVYYKLYGVVEEGLPKSGKTIVKARDESDARDKAIDKLNACIDYKYDSLEITEVIFWDLYYEDDIDMSNC